VSDRNSTLQDGTQFDQDTTPKELSLTLSQTLYSGGRRKLAKQQANADYEAVKAQYQVSAIAIADEIINDYIDLMSAQKTYDILNDNVRSLVNLETAVKARQQAGDSSRTDIAQTTARLASAKAQRSETQAQLAQARDAIRSKTDQFIEGYKMPLLARKDYTTSLDSAINIARDKNYQIKSALSEEEAAEFNLRTQKRGWLPTVSLEASARAVRDSSPTIDSDDDLRAGISFSMPLYAGGQ